MKNIGKGFWVVLFGLGVIFTPGLTFILTEGSISNGFEDKEQKKDKDNDKNIVAVCIINPCKLNLKSKGKWITAYIELSKGYDPYDIVLGAILLNGFLSPAIKPYNIEDSDNNGILELMIKFDRSQIISNLESSQFCEMTITGKLIDGIIFKATSTIELIN